MNIDYVVISSDDNPLYKDFYAIVAKQWYRLGFKTYYINITDTDEKIENQFGIIHKIKALDFVSTGFQAQVVRPFCCKFIQGNLLMSDIDMLPLQKEYFNKYAEELTEDNVIIYSGQPYTTISNYPMCYILSNSKNFLKYLDIHNIDFSDYCKMLINNYGEKWYTDESFMYHKLQLNKEKLVIKNRNSSDRIDRANWNYNLNMLKSKFYIDSHLLRPYSQYKKEIDELINSI